MGRLWNGRYRIVFSVRNLGYISNWWLGSRRYRAAQCLPCLHQRGLEVKSFVNAHILSYSMNSPIISVDSSTILMMKVRCRHHQAYLSFDSFVRLIIFVSRNSASPSLSAARKAHSRAKIVIGSPMPPPTTVSMWKGCLVALRRNKMPQVCNNSVSCFFTIVIHDSHLPCSTHFSPCLPWSRWVSLWLFSFFITPYASGKWEFTFWHLETPFDAFKCFGWLFLFTSPFEKFQK